MTLIKILSVITLCMAVNAQGLEIPFLSSQDEGRYCLSLNGSSPYQPEKIHNDNLEGIEILPKLGRIDMGFYETGVDLLTDHNADGEPDLTSMASWVKYTPKPGSTNITLNRDTYAHFGISQAIKREKYRDFDINSTFERTNKILHWEYLVPLEHVNGYNYPLACNVNFNYILAPVQNKNISKNWRKNNELVLTLLSMLQNISIISGPLVNKPLKYIQGYNQELRLLANGMYRIVVRKMDSGDLRSIAYIIDEGLDTPSNDECNPEVLHELAVSSVTAIELKTGLEFKGLGSIDNQEPGSLKSLFNNDDEFKRYQRARTKCH